MQNPLKLITIFLSIFVMYLPVEAQVEGGRADYDLGVFAFEEGNYVGAESHLTKALEFEPGDLLANYFMGKTYIKMERYQDAETYLTPVWETDPEISGLQFDWAYLHFKLEDYSKAAALFMDVANKDPDNILALYYAGITLFKSGQYKKAADHLVSAADKSPSVKDNGYFFSGICYQRIGDMEKAVEKFEYLKSYAESQALRESASEWLKALEKMKKAYKPYSLYVKLGYQYDDNVTLDFVDEDQPSGKDDFVSVLFFSGKYHLIDTATYQIGAGYSHYQTWHQDLTDYDMVGFIGSIYGKYRLYPLTCGITYYPTYYRLGGDGFLMRHHIKPELTYEARDNLLLRLSFNYYSNNYLEDHNRSGHTNEGELKILYGLANKRGYCFGEIGVENNHSSHPDYDYAQYQAHMGASINVMEKLILKISGELYDKIYDNIDSFFGVKRSDTKYRGSISLSSEIFYEWLTLSGEFEYTKNNSNINDYEYRETVTTLSVSARY